MQVAQNISYKTILIEGKSDNEIFTNIEKRLTDEAKDGWILVSHSHERHPKHMDDLSVLAILKKETW